MGGPVSGPLPQAWPSAPDEAGCGVLGEAERCGRGGGRGMGGEMGHSRGYCTAVPQAPRSRRGAAPAGRGLSSPGAVGQWPGIGVWGWRVSRAGGRQGWWEPSVACGVVLYNDWRWGGACCSPSGQWPLRWRCYKNEGGGGHAAGDGAGPAWGARRWWDGPWNCNAVLLGLFVCTDRPGRGARRAPPRRARRPPPPALCPREPTAPRPAASDPSPSLMPLSPTHSAPRVQRDQPPGRVTRRPPPPPPPRPKQGPPGSPATQTTPRRWRQWRRCGAPPPLPPPPSRPPPPSPRT